MNFVYFSPNFPTFGWKFCHFLKQNGVNVLGIGDEPYDSLRPELKQALTEYYYVHDMQNYDKVYRACACFISHHGKIDHLLSNNEFWLITEAKLRKDFNIEGMKYPEILDHKQKSYMKKFFEQAGVEAPNWCLPKSFEEGKAFTDVNGFSVVVKPDDGVGACNTYTLHNESELADFFTQKHDDSVVIMEEFIDGHVETFDGITDKFGNILFCASQIYHQSLMDTVLNDDHISYHSVKKIALDIDVAGRKIVKAYGIKNTFFHFEFFRTKDKKGNEKLIALEVNMRPPGGMITEIYEASHDLNIYKAWADIIVFGKSEQNTDQKRFAGYASRKHRFTYVHTHDKLINRYGENIMDHFPIYGVTSRAMGDYGYLLFANSQQEVLDMIHTIHQRY